MTASPPETVLRVEDLKVHFPLGGGLFGAKSVVKAVDGVALTLEKGQIRGLIGPHGEGKSTVIDAITGRPLPATLSSSGQSRAEQLATLMMSKPSSTILLMCVSH